MILASSSTSATRNNSNVHNTSETESSTTSTVTSLSKKNSKSESEHNVSSSHLIHTVEGATSLEGASAQYIAVDGSSVNVTKNYSVTLAGSAEQNATALNIVNAAGSMVANGLNVTHATNNLVTTLTQVNSISQSH